LYQCALYGKMVIGFEKEEHAREKHWDGRVEWKVIKVRKPKNE